MQSLERNGFLDGRSAIFDYGCGRGDDIRGLKENGIEAAGWDPHYAPDERIESADIVNLGFVINVIEDFEERVQALSNAYGLARHILVVSAMLLNENAVTGQRFGESL